MTDYKNIQEYEKHVQTLSVRDLRGISRHIDKGKYADRYAVVLEALKVKQNETQVDSEQKITIPKYFLCINGILTFGGLLAVVIECVLLFTKYRSEFNIGATIGNVCYAFGGIRIRKGKTWGRQLIITGSIVGILMMAYNTTRYYKYIIQWPRQSVGILIFFLIFSIIFFVGTIWFYNRNVIKTHIQNIANG
jgi:hypothetical protein